MKFAIYITNTEHDALKNRKIYRVLPDVKANEVGGKIFGRCATTGRGIVEGSGMI